jgi:hypothetical protein
MLGIFVLAYAQFPDEFIAKAENTGKILAKKETERIRLKKRFEYTAKKIDELKEEKAKGGFSGAISSMKLGYYLKTGNITGYRQYILNDEIRELRDERLSYIMIIIDGYTKTLEDCFKSKCPQAAGLFGRLEKWMSSLDEYKDMLQIDFDFRGMIGGLKPDAKDDLKKYMESKIVQADERLYLLKEEKNILKEAKAAGIMEGAKTGDKNSREIQELEKMKSKIKGMIDGMK